MDKQCHGSNGSSEILQSGHTGTAKAVQAGKLDPEWLTAQAAKSREVTGYDILEVIRRVA